MSNAFIAFQKNDDSRCIVEAILEDNPGAMVVDQPSMVKIDVPNRLVIKRETVEEKMRLLGLVAFSSSRATY